MDLRIPPLKIKILLESNPLKSINLSTEIGHTSGMPVEEKRKTERGAAPEGD